VKRGSAWEDPNLRQEFDFLPPRKPADDDLQKKRRIAEMMEENKALARTPWGDA
jgi:hypothetical protein